MTAPSATMTRDAISPIVERLLQALTLEEKVSLLSGANMWETAPVERLGIPALKMTDGPAGARGAKWTYGSLTTFIPCGMSLAATWDSAIVEKIGTVLGEETRHKGCQVLLAPTMNLSRSPLGGRNFEGYGEDPFLIGAMSTAIIRGIQSQGVGACMKHFILNDTETRRFNVDQTIDERTLREVYMKPFIMALNASPWTGMVSYPKINGLHADMSPTILPKLLREELQFDRLVMSDWGGCNSTAESLIATTDLEMPGPPVRRGERLLAAIRDGEIDEITHVNPSVRRMLQLLERAQLLPSLAELDNPSQPFTKTHEDVEEGSNAPIFQQITREAAQGGLVLLKNDNALPLQPSTLQALAIIGPNARKPTAGGAGSAAVNPFYITTPEKCLTDAVRSANPETKISYEQGIPFSLRPPLLGDALTVPDGSQNRLLVQVFSGHTYEGPVLATSVWADSLVYMMSDGDVPQSLKGNSYCYQASGVLKPSRSGRYTISLANTGKAKLFIDNKLVIDNADWTRPCGGFLGCSSEDRTATLDLEANVSYVLRVDNLATPPPMKAFDNTLFPNISGLRVGLALEENERVMLERAVTSAREADVAVLVVGHNKDSEGEGGDRVDMELPGRTNELITSVCDANPNTIVVVQAASAVSMPWADRARAIVLGWYQGQENGHALADALLGKCNFSGKTPITFPRQLDDHGSSAWFPKEAARDHAVIGEKVLIGYRWFEEKQIAPLWPFGFGLSYTSFVLSDIHMKGTMTRSPESFTTIHARVTNTGKVDGHEVVQVYVSPSEKIRQNGLMSYQKTLAGFTKIYVPTGQSRDVSIVVKREEMRWYNEKAAQWQVDAGSYHCFVGTSVCDIDRKISFQIE